MRTIIFIISIFVAFNLNAQTQAKQIMGGIPADSLWVLGTDTVHTSSTFGLGKWYLRSSLLGGGGSGGSGVSDHDWYEVGTTTPPNAITDDMFHTGKVVVGHTTPFAQMNVVSDLGLGIYKDVGVNSTDSIGGKLFLGDINFYNSGYFYKASGLAAIYNSSTSVASDLGFFAYNGSAQIERMRIKASGEVGIGTGRPARLLDVRGTMRLTGSTGTPSIIMGRNGSGDVGAITTGAGISLSGGILSAVGLTDHDWYEVGTTTPPNAITDDMFHNGRTGIGLTTLGAWLDLKSGANDYSTQALRITNSDNTALANFTSDGRFFIGPDNGQNSYLTVNRSTGNGKTVLFEMDNADGVDLGYYSSASTFYESINGASGKIAWGNTGLLAEQMVLNTANTRLGIGNNTPLQTLHVTGTMRLTGSTGTATTIMGRDASGDVSAMTAGAGISFTSGAIVATDFSSTNEAWTIDGDDPDQELISNQIVKFEGQGGIVTDYVPSTNVLEIECVSCGGTDGNGLWTDSNDGDNIANTSFRVGVPGYLEFGDGTDWDLYIDAANDRIGMGTNNPTYGLHVVNGAGAAFEASAAAQNVVVKIEGSADGGGLFNEQSSLNFAYTDADYLGSAEQQGATVILTKESDASQWTTLQTTMPENNDAKVFVAEKNAAFSDNTKESHIAMDGGIAFTQNVDISTGTTNLAIDRSYYTINITGGELDDTIKLPEVISASDDWVNTLLTTQCQVGQTYVITNFRSGINVVVAAYNPAGTGSDDLIDTQAQPGSGFPQGSAISIPAGQSRVIRCVRFASSIGYWYSFE